MRKSWLIGRMKSREKVKKEKKKEEKKKEEEEEGY